MIQLGRMESPLSGLPDFENPPVVETVLGVQFTAVKGFTLLHYGLYWEKIRGQYPNAQIVPPLGSASEEFGAEAKPRAIQFSMEIADAPEVRCWFIDDSQNHLFQVQNDRFIHNWRKVTGDEKYPHYEHIRPKFKEEWVGFCEFLDKQKLSRPDINQCEVTYVNHIELEGPVKTFSDLPKAISGWSDASSGRFLPNPEKVTFKAAYVMSEKKGRLHITVQPVIRSRDGKEVFQLNLTARGKPASSQLNDVLEWFDLGRGWIVRGFTDFTTPEMHTFWRRTHDR